MNFVHLYKSAAEVNVKLSTKEKIEKPKGEKIKSKVVDNSTDVNPLLNNVSSKKARKKDKVKVATDNNNSDNFNIDMADIKPKKRNKSVSFMLDEKVEVAVKKTKSDTSANDKQAANDGDISKKSRKKIRNKSLVNMDNGNIKIEKMDIETNMIEKTKNLKRNFSVKLDSGDSNHTKLKLNKKSKKNFKSKESGDYSDEQAVPEIVPKTQELIENKKHNKQNKEYESDISGSKSDKEQPPKTKRSKKKKHPSKAAQNNVTQSEPKNNFQMNHDKPEAIAGNLENLKIGDNTHTLSNLLDEMTVVDKQKQKKNKIKKKKDKIPVTEYNDTEVKESKKKEKWTKKKWNKGVKGKDDADKGLHPVTVENLPINLMLTYKKLLTEHFSQYGTVRKVGIAQIYPAENTKPVFSTTVFFNTSEEMTKALEEDNTLFQGTIIRVKRPFPPTETTAVVHTFGPLSEQIISTIFSGVGRIRRIKQFVKGKKFMSTAFVELDEPEAVERAIKLAEEVKVGGKNIYVTKYQVHEKKKKKKHTKAFNTSNKQTAPKDGEKKEPAAESHEDSDESND